MNCPKMQQMQVALVWPNSTARHFGHDTNQPERRRLAVGTADQQHQTALGPCLAVDRQELQQALAAVLKDSFLAVYRANLESGPYRIDQPAMGKRSLKNTCLGYLMELDDDDDVLRLCVDQYRTGGNMTDVMAALVNLANSDRPERAEALASFYETCKNDPLVMDKWLAILATSRLPGTLGTVQALLTHPVFTLRNPNKVRALIVKSIARTICSEFCAMAARRRVRAAMSAADCRTA